jgi:hypothetical protein
MRMPAGLRNAGPTFCRMTKVALKDQVGRNVLCYVDDIVVASKNKESYISGLSEIFTKCAWLTSNSTWSSVFLG